MFLPRPVFDDRFQQNVAGLKITLDGSPQGRTAWRTVPYLIPPDGQKKGYDAQCFLQRFTPRRARSTWSKINVARIESLLAAGRMRPAGLREVEAARADGRWDAAYDGAKSMEVPPELAKALAKNRKAKAFFDTLDKTNRYAVCWRVQTAVKPETRQARVEKLVAMLARGEKIHGA